MKCGKRNAGNYKPVNNYQSLESSGVDTLVVYTPRLTARLTYIIQTVLPGVTVTDSKEKIPEYGKYCLNYSDEIITGSFRILPHDLLLETGITAQQVQISYWEELPVFFQTEGDLPFDVFAAAFYLLSRYEEYLPHSIDQYGRYSHTNSIAYKEGFLKQPLVNLWLKKLSQKLQRFTQDSRLTAHDSRFTFIPTYDIDEAFSYLHKPLWKNVLGFYRDLLQGKFEQVIERGNVYSGKKKDPYDTFDWIHRLHEKCGLQPIYFLLTILKRGVYDKNLSAHSKALQQLYRGLAVKNTIGLHPSWQSGTEERLLEEEKSFLQKIIQQPVIISRQHYLRFTLPDTYRRLLAAGMTDDYSMAYGGVNGFRASYCLPFYWYDLAQEITTTLRIHPFCFMEASSYFNQGYTAEQAAEEIQYYHDIVKEVNGEFITLFHNHFLTDQPQWRDWRGMYEAFLSNNFG